LKPTLTSPNDYLAATTSLWTKYYYWPQFASYSRVCSTWWLRLQQQAS